MDDIETDLFIRFDRAMKRAAGANPIQMVIGRLPPPCAAAGRRARR
jgi:hypothetical protein